GVAAVEQRLVFRLERALTAANLIETIDLAHRPLEPSLQPPNDLTKSFAETGDVRTQFSGSDDTGVLIRPSLIEGTLGGCREVVGVIPDHALEARKIERNTAQISRLIK